jgi:aldose 1-epimerase
VIAPSGEQFEIALGEQRATVVEVGGGLRSYSVGDREILDGYGLDEAAPSGRGQVLVPWPNRVEDGAYEFDGRSHELPLNELERRNAIHGLVRWSAWTLAERGPDRVALEHVRHPQPGYPFTLALGIEYSLSERGLAVRTTATNAGRAPSPYGFGQHPYFFAGPETVDSAVLRVPARTVLRADERGIPRGADPVEGTDYDFREPRPIGATQLDHAFTDLERGSDGLARVELSDPAGGARLTVWMDEAYPYVQVFTGDPLPDVARRSLAVEPMTCPANAFRTGEALVRLEPGASHTGVWGIEIAI